MSKKKATYIVFGNENDSGTGKQTEVATVSIAPGNSNQAFNALLKAGIIPIDSDREFGADGDDGYFAIWVSRSNPDGSIEHRMFQFERSDD